jgi:hypothetical protein
MIAAGAARQAITEVESTRWVGDAMMNIVTLRRADRPMQRHEHTTRLGLLRAAVVACVALAAAPAIGQVPSNGWVVWASNRQQGRHEVYLMKADGSDARRLTTEGGRFPSWSPNGAYIAYLHTADSSTHVMRWDGSEDRELCGTGYEPRFWMPDGSGFVCGLQDRYLLADPCSGGHADLLQKTDFAGLSQHDFWPNAVSYDGRYLLGHSQRAGAAIAYDNGTFTAALNATLVLDLTDKSRTYFLGAGCEPTSSPTGDVVVHVNSSAPSFPHLYRMSLGDLATRSSYVAEMDHVDVDWGHEYMPRISTDGRWLTYAASTGCHDHDECDYEVFLHELGKPASERTRLTFDAGNDQWPHLYVGALWHSEAPQLCLFPPVLHFEIQDLQPPPGLNVGASNAGGGTLPPLQTAVSYDAGGVDWLQVEVAGSGNLQELVNHVTRTGLPRGRSSARVNVIAAGALSSPRRYTVVVESDGKTLAGCALAPGVAAPVWPMLIPLLGLLAARGRRRGSSCRSRS